MANLNLIHVSKVYKGDVKAVTDFTMEIQDGEFIVFVGPSGCGKSTTLRMIAGLEDISDGELYIDNKYMNDVEPKDRDLAMVFQNYALYPYLTSYDNIAFGLRMRKIKVFEKDEKGNPIYIIDKKKIKEYQKEIASLTKELKNDVVNNKEELNEKINKLNELIKEEETSPSLEKFHLRKYTKEEIDERVNRVAKMLGISDYLSRKPGSLSGGQRQRVALGRAIVREAKVYLFDEPLSNLDAKLRAAMRVEIINLHHKLKTTFIYVTHDQVEAMTMGDRIVVMKDGFIKQIDTPTNLYDYPNNQFVAGFIGTPQMNFFDVKIQKEDRYYLYFNEETKLHMNELNLKEDYKDLSSFEAVLGVRSEDIHLAKGNENSLKAVVHLVEILGSDCLVYLGLKDVDNVKEFVMKLQTRCLYQPGDIIRIAFNKENIHLFDKESENSVLIKKKGEI